jgi:hypothetical protein
MNIQKRFEGAPWLTHLKLFHNSKQTLTVFIIGAGGVGSWLALFLSRIGFLNIAIYDDDVIESSNIGGQFYRTNNLNERKVSAVTRNIIDYSGFHNISAIAERFNPNTQEYHPNFTFVTVDSITTRKEIFDWWVKGPPGPVYTLFDSRMSMENFQIFTVQGDDPKSIEEYKKTFFEPSDIAPVLCTQKATSHCGAITAAYMTSLFTNQICRIFGNSEERETPFSIDVCLPFMVHNIKEIKNEPAS